MSERALTVPPAEIAHLRSLPGFPLAMRRSMQSTVAIYRSDRLLNALLSDRARALFSHVALYLHYAGSRSGGAGLTVGAMKDLCVQVGLCSRGRCEAMLALMRATGLFAAAPGLDRRRRPLVPTEKLLALHRERWGAHLDALSAAMPEACAYRRALDHPAFVATFVLELGRRFVAGLRVLDAAPELEPFAERNAGMMVLYSLALAGPAEGPVPPTEPVPLSINALAKRFAVSRKHVLTLLRDAEALGLLARGGTANDQVTFTPRGRDALETMLATMFLYLMECADEALRVSEGSGAAVAAPVD